jgi:hypothetical protein
MTIKRISLVIPATPGDAIFLPELLIPISAGKNVPPAMVKKIEKAG